MDTVETTSRPTASHRFLYFCLRRINPCMKRLLRSRLHHLVSGSLLLVTFTGRRSGRSYTTPVSYIREQDMVTFVTPRVCRWWVNIPTGSTVTLLLAGREHTGEATLLADDQAEKVIRIRRLLELLPRDARYYPVTLDAEGKPDPAELASAAREHVVVLVRLLPEPTRQAEESAHTHVPSTVRRSQ